MLNKFLYPEKHIFKINYPVEIFGFSNSLYPDVYPLKQDPYQEFTTIDDDKILSKYLSFQEKNNLYIYYTRSFSEPRYTGKPIFPYFKAKVRTNNNETIIEGKLKIHILPSTGIPFILIGIILIILISGFSLAFLLFPLAILGILKISSINIKNEFVHDINVIFETIAK